MAYADRRAHQLLWLGASIDKQFSCVFPFLLLAATGLSGSRR